MRYIKESAKLAGWRGFTKSGRLCEHKLYHINRYAYISTGLQCSPFSFGFGFLGFAAYIEEAVGDVRTSFF